MSKRLDKVKLVKGRQWERQDPIDNIGVSTYVLIKDAIQEGRNDLAKDLADYVYFWETKFARDTNFDLIAGWPEFVRINYGEYAEIEDQRAAMIQTRMWKLPFTEKPTVQKREQSPYDYTMGYGWRMLKYHRMGKNDGAGGFTIEEYPDRYEFVWDPCYSGGRPRRGDPVTGTPPRTSPLYTGNQVPHPWSWGKTGVPGYCMHCALIHNIMDVEQRGYLQWASGYPDDPWKPCTYIAYKDVDWIPEEYYTRIGRTKPKVTSTAPRPKDVNKLIRVIHSDELGPEWVPTLTMLKKAIDAGKKKEALKIVDQMRDEMGRISMLIWNWSWMELIIEKYGYNELYHALRSIPCSYALPPAPEEPRPTKADIPNAEERARRGALWGRSDRSGPNADCSVNIIDEPDRVVMELAPCGSGGRGLMTIDTPGMERGPVTGNPWNFKTTPVAHPVAWNKVGVPNYCARCCVHMEMGSLSRYGYLTTVIERPENATDPNCRWFFYRDVDDIPEKYYTRIGAKKPARQK
ncbi:MAG: hypothetical protein V1767_07610 [Chloroflexota bacterium]